MICLNPQNQCLVTGLQDAMSRYFTHVAFEPERVCIDLSGRDRAFYVNTEPSVKAKEVGIHVDVNLAELQAEH